MAKPDKCPWCGAELARDGHCVRCLLELGLTPPEEAALGRGAESEAPLPLAPYAEAAAAEKPGDRIGHYRLVRPIGAGGFGVVFLAEQEEPVRRRVALKVIKLGMDTTEVVRRFEAERQALALMDHPNIARVLDCGATDTGRPYFVMDFVEGVRITDYCDARRLSLRQRLELFIQVCHAVQHAHQKGVIHRDLKPSNILVAEQDGKPVPKVIDFGIAKAAFDQGRPQETRVTTFQQFAGTLGYMSPEQAGLGGQDVDARSDIYSLGTLLYELLTAQPALESAELRRAAMDEAFRLIREQEPPRPSARLTTLASDTLTTVAHCRQTDPAKLPNLLRGDLDWIVMKALEKDRNRRYETANGLAMDLQRHLNHEPVVARPPSRWYRLQKLVRRNRLVVVAGCSVVAALSVGLGLSTWSLLQERAARKRAVTAEARARTEAGKSAQVAKFLKEMLQSVGPSVAQGRDTKLLREILDKTVKRAGNELKAQPEVEADLLSTIGKVYRELGDYELAEALDRKVLSLRKKVFGSEHPKVADALNNLANALYRESKLKEAEATHREALAMRIKFLGTEHTDVAASLNNLASVLWAEGKLGETEDLYRRALAMRRKLFGNTNEDVAESLDNLGGILSARDKLAEAEVIQRESVALNQKLLGTNNPDLAFSLNNLADTLHAEGKLIEAEATNRQVLLMRMRLLGPDHPDVAFSLYNLAGVLADEGKLAEAERLHRDALRIRRKRLGTNSLDVASSLNNLAGVLIQEGRFDEAEAMQRECLVIQRKRLGAEHPDIAGSLDNLALALKGRGKLTDAEAMERETLAMRQKLLGPDHLDVALSFYNLAEVLQAEGRLADAETSQRRALALRRKLLGNDHTDVAASLAGLADVLYDEHKYADAEAVQQEELGIRWKVFQQNSPPFPASVSRLADAFSRLTRTLLAEGRFAEAERLARESLAFDGKELPDDWQAFNARSLLGGSLLGQRKFVEAEPLLVTGCEGLKQRQDKIPVEARASCLKQAIQRLVRLYEATDRSAQAAECKKKLAPE